jgi:hypothetical protein
VGVIGTTRARRGLDRQVPVRVLADIYRHDGRLHDVNSHGERELSAVDGETGASSYRPGREQSGEQRAVLPRDC